MLDLSKDYLVMDDLQVVSYYSWISKLPPRFSATPQSVRYVLRREITQKDLETLEHHIQIISQYAFFHFWLAGLTSTDPIPVIITPKINDEFVDPAAQRWGIREIFKCDLDKSGKVQRYKCLAQMLVVNTN